MKTKVASALALGHVDSVVLALHERIGAQLDGSTPSFALVFASTQQPLQQLMPALKQRFPETTLLGASTAGEFTEKSDAKGSTAMVAVAGDYRIFGGLRRGLKADVEATVAPLVSGVPRAVDGYPHRTALLLVDPLAGNGEEATLVAGALLGADARLAGGAAGDDLAMKQTFVAYDGEVASDAGVLAVLYSKAPLGVGVCHGHLPLSDPLRITRADGNVVYEIEGRPAWQVWAEGTRDAAAAEGLVPEKLEADQVTPYLLRYEAGLSTGSDIKIRAPLQRNADGSLAFACGIPEGAVIRITESHPHKQVQSAREAARRARAQMGSEPAGAVVFDCICRKLILGDEFQRAVEGISAELGGVPVAGFETYGEIALDAGDMSGFHNTTTVVLSFPR